MLQFTLLLFMCMGQTNLAQEDKGLEVSEEISKKGQQQGLQYIGVGYDMIKGNPEGDKRSAGIDPGLLLTRKIFALMGSEPGTSSTSDNDKGLDPRDLAEMMPLDHSVGGPSAGDVLSDRKLTKQLVFEGRTSCVTDTHHQIVKDTKSYQGLLALDVGLDAGTDILELFKFKFAASEDFKVTGNLTQVKHSVIMVERQVCNLGTVRYKNALAKANRWPVDDEFAVSVCELPAKDDNSDDEYQAYMKFIEQWGTHVVTQADVGTKNITKYFYTLDSFMTRATLYSNTSVHVGGSGGENAPITLPITASVDIKDLFDIAGNYDKFKTTEDRENIIQGTKELPKPFSIKVRSIVDALTPRYWQTLKEFISSGVCQKGQAEDDILKKKRAILTKALEKYPAYLGAVSPKDLPIEMAITWPKGRYGLPMTDSGCPEADSQHEWHEGWRFQDTANVHAALRTAKIPEHIRIDYDSHDNVRSHYCMKTDLNWRPVSDAHVYDRPWSPGKYCIYKKGSCPGGFVESFIYWKDQRAWTWRGNKLDGSRPDGDYDKYYTKIWFCCRNDGYAENAIFLPSGKPLALFPVERSNCQKVYGMKSQEEIASWDTHLGTYIQGSVQPVSKVTHSRVKLHYCYYYKV